MPPWALAGLFCCLALLSALPAPGGIFGLLGVVILLGVPHGALDGEVARPLLLPRFGWGWFPVFSVPYLGLAAAVLLAWQAAPLPTLAAFLALSVLHFGEDDAEGGGVVDLLARGGMPVALPVLLHPHATARLLGGFAMVPLDLPPPWLHGAVLAWTVPALACMARMVLHRDGRALAEVALLGLAFAVLPPLAGFAFYFVGLHAPRHMAALAADPVRAPRMRTVRAAILRSLPVTGLTLLLGAGLWPFFPGPPGARLLALTFQGLAALTLPHMLLTCGLGVRSRPFLPGRT